MQESSKAPTRFTVKAAESAVGESALSRHIKMPYSSNTAKIRERAAEGARIISKTRAFLRKETGFHPKND